MFETNNIVDYDKIKRFKIANGREKNESESEQGLRVCTANKLLSDTHALVSRTCFEYGGSNLFSVPHLWDVTFPASY